MESGTVGLDHVRYEGQCGTEVDPVRCQCGTGPWAALTEGASLLGSLTRRGRTNENIRTKKSIPNHRQFQRKLFQRNTGKNSKVLMRPQPFLLNQTTHRASEYMTFGKSLCPGTARHYATIWSLQGFLSYHSSAMLLLVH